MKQLISMAVFLLAALAAVSQTSRFTDTVKAPAIPRGNGAISMGIMIGDNQRSNASHSEAILITPSTIIEQRPGYVRLYVNTDMITIVCSGITEKNYSHYKAFKGSAGLPSNKLFEMHHSLSANNLSIINDVALNMEKVLLFNRRFYYCLMDKAGAVAAELTVEFVIPAPAIAYLSYNDTLTKNVRKFEGITTAVSSKSLEIFDKEKRAAAKRGDTNLVLPAGKKALFLYFKSLSRVHHHAVQYRLNGGDWKLSREGINPCFLLDDLQPGNQHVEVRYLGRDAPILEYDFKVEPGPLQTTAFKVFTGSCITAFFCLALFWLNAARQKRRLKQEVQKRTQLQHHLNSLQSRLHPHFVFNALNSIQGLINKNEVEKANVYISKFGALLHDIIGKSDQPMHPLAIELKQIEYYLQLEQLRFKFRYNIVISEGINSSEINIPTLLLQPFVENAIKHGIGEMREEGLVSIIITAEQTRLVVEVNDNGKGFDVDAPTTGRGNSIVRERIDMLNLFLTGQRIALSIASTAASGTHVSLYFYDWL